MYSKRMHGDAPVVTGFVIMSKDAGWCSLGWAAQQQERRCVQVHRGRGEKLKLHESESR